MDVTDRVKSKLSELGMTQIQLAQASGITKSTMNYILTNHKQFEAESIVPIANKLGVTVSWLLTGEEGLNATEIVKEIPMQLREDEQELLDLFRKLDRQGQIEILHTAYQQYGRVKAVSEEKKNEEPVKWIG